MQSVIIWRKKESNQGTEGELLTFGFSCFTLELPWRNNKQNISRIPSGDYIVKIVKSPKFGTVYNIKEVENRSHILIHSGNWAGDIEKGYKSHVYGCILLGKKRGSLLGQRAVLNSRVAVQEFMRHMEYEPFELKIIGG